MVFLLRTLLLLACLSLGTAAVRAAEPEGSGELAAAAVVAPVYLAAPGTPPEWTRVEFPEGNQTMVGAPLPVEVAIAPGSTWQLVRVLPVENPYLESTEAFAHLGEGADKRTRLELVVFRSGTFQGRLELVFVDAGGGRQRLLSEPFALEVRSSILNESAPLPASSDPPMPVVIPDYRPLWAGILLGGALLGMLATLLVRARKRRDVVVEEIRRPAWELAFEALDALAAQDLPAQGQSLEFHTRLSEILREYLGARFSFAAPEMTTSEINRVFRARPEQVGSYADEIHGVLQDMDLVKFARFEPPRDFSGHCFGVVRALVEDLSAREREQGAEVEGAGVVEDGIVGDGVVQTGSTVEEGGVGTGPLRHAPSPESTTESFQRGEALPDNVIPMPRPEDLR